MPSKNKDSFEDIIPQKIHVGASEDDTLMGRLAKRMAARDFIDRFNLGTKSPKKPSHITTSDNSSLYKMHLSGPAKLKSELEKGTEIEKEHTSDPNIAQKIAMDHLNEHPSYYNEKDGLPAMEINLKSREGSNMADQAKNAGNVFGNVPKRETFK